MRTHILNWLDSTSIRDPIEHRLAVLLQILLVIAIAAAGAAILAVLLISGTNTQALATAAANAVLGLIFVGLLALLRTGRFKLTAGILLVILLLAGAGSLYSTGISGSAAPTLVFTITVVIAGLLMRRPVLLAISLASFLIVLSIGLMEIAGQIQTTNMNTARTIESTITVYGMAVVLLTVVLDQFGAALRRSLREVQQHAAALNLERERLQVTLASIGDAVISTDAGGCVTFINPVGEALTGWTNAEAQGKSLNEVFHIVNEDTRARVEDPVFKVLREGMIVGLANHTILIAKDGREFPIDDSGAPIRDAAGSIIGVVLVFRDISGRKEHERYTEKLQDLTSALSEAITPDDAGKVIANAASRLLGAQQSALLLLSKDRSQLEYLHSEGISPQTREQLPTVPMSLASPVTDVVKTKLPVWIASGDEYIQRYPHLEWLIRESSGPRAVAAVPLMARREVIGALTVSFPEDRGLDQAERDFLLALAREAGLALERAELYLAERIARQSAEEANKLKLKFLAMISHELRTPLTSIKGFITTLLTDDVTFTEVEEREFMEIINQESDNLANLVEQLLDLSRLEAGTLSIHAVSQPLSQAIEIARPRLDALCETHNLVLDLPADLPTAIFDAQRIAQVIANLVHNACKYSPEGSEVHISAHRNGDHIEIRVQDQGIGIPPEERDNIFEAFRQAANRPITETKGAGLGLAIARALIETHRGKIWVQERDGTGSVLCFTLPISKPRS